MQQFAGSLLEKKNIALHFDVASLVPSLKLGMEERKNFYLIFKETIHNAVKYADCSIVKVTIDSNDKAINLKIEDNGKGFDTAKTYVGNGMHNLQKRAKEINGILEVASLPGCGTSMLLRIVPTQRDA
jgi:signal transduction histidine kinase